MFAALFSVAPSCALNPEIVTVWGGDAEVPKLVGVEPLSAKEIRATFSAPVSISNAEVAMPEVPGAIITTSWEADGGNSVVFILDESVGVGAPAALSATVADGKGNSLAFSVPFTGYNDHPAKLRINEIRIDYVGAKDKTFPKVEFIEFVVVSSGNLGGVEVYNAANAARPSYEFPPVEVSAGDFIVYHLRSIEEGLVNETGAIDASAGTDAKPTARDFWDTQTRKPFKDDNVILVRERKAGPIMDALLYVATKTTDWPSDTVKAAAELAFSSGAWKPGSDVSDAAGTKSLSPTRTLGRDSLSRDTDSSSDWAVCAQSKYSPGMANPAR
jgi:hypothetical protein